MNPTVTYFLLVFAKATIFSLALWFTLSYSNTIILILIRLCGIEKRFSNLHFNIITFGISLPAIALIVWNLTSILHMDFRAAIVAIIGGFSLYKIAINEIIINQRSLEASILMALGLGLGYYFLSDTWPIYRIILHIAPIVIILTAHRAFVYYKAIIRR